VLQGPGINGQRTERQGGGTTNRSVTFDNLQPNQTYTYQIKKNDGQVRYQGQFTTNSNNSSASSGSSNSGNPASDTPGEVNLPDAVDIQGTPQVNATNDSATITWNTNNVAATDVWLEGGGINGHRTEYDRGGSRNHSVSFNNLKGNTSYTYMIRSR